MDFTELKKLAEIEYPESISVPLLRGKKAVLGPITMDVISLVEKKFGSLEGLQKAFTKDEIKKSDIISVVFMLMENKSDFKDADEFSSHVPLSIVERLLTILYHYMYESFPSVKSDDKDSAGESEEKKL